MNEILVFGLAHFKLPMGKNRFLLMLVGVNFIFTGLDVALAHAVNNFVPAYEWIPILYAPLGAVSSFIVALRSKLSKLVSLTHIFLMALGVVVGILGTAFHANQALNPLGQLTWIWITFASPILAPLSFAGISLVGLYGATEEAEGQPGRMSPCTRWVSTIRGRCGCMVIPYLKALRSRPLKKLKASPD